ncbi:flagellar motor protein [Salipiger pallidus]|uniref:Flagellar motor protein n=1 Tax=Salipiger pallidus TaxID=1775170 RepID=A0A8J2ZJB8_9RHOB|nr:peptidoglycan -binding protein [Salipiger pallidus]GGG69879.1 flagellar motor protein [Salipiger pallidus]
MSLSRRTGSRFQANIWPGFVDAMTGLLLVLMFVLTIFMVIQSVLRDTITGQESQLDRLAGQVAELATALGVQERQNAALTGRLGELEGTLNDTRDQLEQSRALVSSLTAERDEQAGRIASFEDQVASLLADRDEAEGRIAELTASEEALQDARDQALSERDALDLALAQARAEVDAEAETARLAAARREALQALVEDLRAEAASRDDTVGRLSQQVSELESQLTDEEAQRLAEAEAARALRERLENADAELTAMSMALEDQRQRAEDTLTLLAAARDRAEEAEALRDQLSDAEREAALLQVARDELSDTRERAEDAERETELLNQQMAALRGQLGDLQSLLDDARERDAASQVQLQSLGQDLNQALAQVAAEERRRRQLEEAERKRLEEQNRDLELYRSEFFGRLRDLIGNQDGVRIEGDRFVFSSEVLFPPGGAELSQDGEREIANIAGILRGVMDDIPDGIDWILRVDGHTDDTPIRFGGDFADNWELSQARALSVVRYLSQGLGFPPSRLAANGFGEFQPIDSSGTAAARAANRRIELKLTER